MMPAFAREDTPEPGSSEELPTSYQAYDEMAPRRPITQRNSNKERRNPPVTPRRFSKFFTPRSSQSELARPALRDVTNTANVRNAIQSSQLRPRQNVNSPEQSPAFPRDVKRRKLFHTPESSPEYPKETHPRVGCASPFNKQDAMGCMQSKGHISQGDTKEGDAKLKIKAQQPKVTRELGIVSGNTGYPLLAAKPCKRIVTVERRGLGGQLLLRGRSQHHHHVHPVTDWRNETASFYSRPEEFHEVMGPNLPFCATALNTNPLVAIGDQAGRVSLLDSEKGANPSFRTIFTSFRVHQNAIVDMVFSRDDMLLATGSGDQSAMIVDMMTQRTTHIFYNHCASVKQVRFQPSDNNILATSGRDGRVQLWDLRCKRKEVLVMKHHFPVVERNGVTVRDEDADVSYGYPVNGIRDAHKVSYPLSKIQNAVDLQSRGDSAGRAGDVSVTAIQFLPAGQDHLLLTASEADASVKLWDMRCLHKYRRRQEPIPISYTKPPQNHSEWRHFGITSMNLSGDGSRLYTLCKDNSVYVYSTNHLILGKGSQYSEEKVPVVHRTPKEALAPLYAFRHPLFHASAFFVKSALRQAKDDKSELLAVGSADGCAVLFPTDERYLSKHEDEDYERRAPRGSLQVERSMLTRSGSASSVARTKDSIPIFRHGTPLIRGHDTQVESVTWTSNGELVTVGDDNIVRCWREGADARSLRVGGEKGGKRWMSGWADVSEEYDRDEY